MEVLFFILFLGFARWKFEKAVWLVLLGVPAFLLRGQVFGIPTTALELAIYALGLSLVWRQYQQDGWLSWSKAVKRYLKRWSSWVWLLLGWGLFGGWSLAEQPLAAAGIIKGWFVDPLLLILVLKVTFKDVAQVWGRLGALLGSAFLVAGYGLLDWWWWQDLTLAGRLDSFFSSPNYVALYLVPLTILGVGLWLGIVLKRWSPPTRVVAWRWGLGLVNITLIAALWLTDSTVGIFSLALGVFLLVFGLIAAGVNFNKQRPLFLVAGVLFSLWLLSKYSTGFVHYNQFFGMNSWQTRTDIWRASWAMVETSPWSGIGLANFDSHFKWLTEWRPGLFKYPLDFLNSSHAHNFWLELWLGVGLVGVFFFAYLIYLFYRRLLKRWLTTRDFQVWLVLVLMTVWLSQGLVDTTYFKNDLSVVFWLILLAGWLV